MTTKPRYYTFTNLNAIAELFDKHAAVALAAADKTPTAMGRRALTTTALAWQGAARIVRHTTIAPKQRDKAHQWRTVKLTKQTWAVVDRAGRGLCKTDNLYDAREIADALNLAAAVKKRAAT